MFLLVGYLGCGNIFVWGRNVFFWISEGNFDWSVFFFYILDEDVGNFFCFDGVGVNDCVNL